MTTPRTIKASFNFGKPQSQAAQATVKPEAEAEAEAKPVAQVKPATQADTQSATNVTPIRPSQPKLIRPASDYEKLTNTWITALASELASEQSQPANLQDFTSALNTEIATGIRWQATLCAMQAHIIQHIEPDNIELLTCRLTGSPIGVIDATTVDNASGLTPQLTVMSTRSLSAVREHQPIAYLSYILSTFWIVDPATGNPTRGEDKRLNSYALHEADRVSSLKSAYAHILTIMSNIEPELAYAISRVADVVLSAYMTRNRADTMLEKTRIRAAQIAHDWLASIASVTTNEQASRDFIMFITNLAHILSGSHEKLATAVIVAHSRSRDALIGSASYAPSSSDWSVGFSSANSASVKHTRGSSQRERAAIERQQAVLELRLKPLSASVSKSGQARQRRVSQRTLDAEAAATDIFSDISITLD